MDSEIARIYGKRVRIRVCGLLFEDEAMLVVNHRSLRNHDFWAPPGGGVEFKETIDEALSREVLEESGLQVKVLDFAFGCEFIKDPLHAIELFFWVEKTGGLLRKGYDPELQIIEDLKFMTPYDIMRLPSSHVHGIFKWATTKTEFQQLKGFYRI